MSFIGNVVPARLLAIFGVKKDFLKFLGMAHIRYERYGPAPFIPLS